MPLFALGFLLGRKVYMTTHGSTDYSELLLVILSSRRRPRKGACFHRPPVS